MRKKFFIGVKRALDSPASKVIASIVVLILAIAMRVRFGVELENVNFWGYSFEIFDFSIFTTIVIAAFIAYLYNALDYFVTKQVEEDVKLNWDSDYLCKLYSLNQMFEYDGQSFPIEIVWTGNCKNIEIADSQRMYELPGEVVNNISKQIDAHKTSRIFNNLNIRLDDAGAENGRVILSTSRTTYYSTLVTERALDNKLIGNLTLRDLLEPGPFLSRLKNSRLSNHLGMNAALISADGKIVFVKRGDKVSVSKNSLGMGIAASVKCKYALDRNGAFSAEGLANALRQEISDEIGIQAEISAEGLAGCLAGVYRYVVEGGQPQLLFAVRVDYSSDQILELFNSQAGGKSELKGMKRDGSNLVFVDFDQVKSATFDVANSQVHFSGGDVQKMSVSQLSNLALLCKWLNEFDS